MEKPEWLTKLEDQPCKCVSCPECNGTGTVYFEMAGRKYLGSSLCDDLDEIESCDMCRSGYVEECARCAQLRDYEDQELAERV